MKVKKNYTEEEILSGARVGWEFELYSNMDHIETARSISKYIGKRVVVPMALSNLKTPKPLYHSPIAPSSDIFKLEPDYSGGKTMCELVTGPMDYREARNILIKIFEWINQNGYTTERCSIHVNISIDPNKIPTLVNTPQINIVKFILDFDENRVYDVFPQRKESVYARSIKTIYPNRVMFYQPSIEEFSRSTMTLPADEKYYGVNFLKAEKGYLEYRYMGGKDYQKKTRKILDLVNYYIMHMTKTLNFDGVFTDVDKSKFKKMMEVQKQAYLGFIKYGEFKQRFPDIEVTIDMNNDDQVLQAVWNNLREKLYDLIVTGGMRKGKFNYDTEVGRFQLRETALGNCKVSDIEFVECEAQGIMDRCWFYSCKLKNSRITNSYMMKDNTIDSSKIADTPLHITNVCNDCFIENKRYVINCEVNNGVIRNGEIGKLAKISKETMIVELLEPAESPGSFKENDGDKKKEEKDAKKKA
jgi:hypothetical protein